ncbi:secreted protein [Coprinopsis sp. MPI-PUGE-AT-0042]|nr:secreted protein [Coprinopsis sp. MPI-PUGE-AT-0042]
MKLALLTSAIILATSVAATPVKRQTYTPYFPPVTEMAYYCLNPFNIAACLAAHGHAQVASMTAWDYFPDSLHNGKGDALRHCYWNARMTIDIGITKAKIIADNHENGATENPANEKAMDLANNETGRSIGASAAGATKEEKYDNALQECYTRASEGKLVVITDE